MPSLCRVGWFHFFFDSNKNKKKKHKKMRSGKTFSYFSKHAFLSLVYRVSTDVFFTTSRDGNFTLGKIGKDEKVQDMKTNLFILAGWWRKFVSFSMVKMGFCKFSKVKNHNKSSKYPRNDGNLFSATIFYGSNHFRYKKYVDGFCGYFSENLNGKFRISQLFRSEQNLLWFFLIYLFRTILTSLWRQLEGEG